MRRRGYYSPVLRRDLVTKLYHTARELRVPMTVLNDRIVEAALNSISVRETDQQYQAERNQPAT